jgi:hypothetical protein
MKKIAIVWSTVVLVAATVACSQQSPALPSAAATATVSSAAASSTATVVTDALTGVTLTMPMLSTPNDNQVFKFTDQPLTLTVKNAVTTGKTALTYSFQVASDAAFTSLVVTQDGVAQGANGQTSLVINKLAGAKTYFWRARAFSGTLAGLYAPARSFSVGPEIVLQTPVPASPAQNATVSGNASLIVNNIQRSGPVTQIFYRFDVADSSSFGHIVFTANVAEQSGDTQTSASVPGTLSAGTYSWRVSAADPASGISTPFSAVFSFKFQPFTMSQATIVNSPFDLATWGETAKITAISFNPGYFLVDFDKRDGPDRWPDTPFGTQGGSLEYTLGMCLNINGHWYCSAVVQFWYGRDFGASSPPADVHETWFYDVRWGPMQQYQPADGETVGIFVCAGNCRNNTAGDNSYVKERSNVVFVPWSNGGGADYSFSTGPRVTIANKR